MKVIRKERVVLFTPEDEEERDYLRYLGGLSLKISELFYILSRRFHVKGEVNEERTAHLWTRFPLLRCRVFSLMGVRK